MKNKTELAEELATEWVNEVVPKIYVALLNAGISYNEDLLCEALSDGFIAGYGKAIEARDAQVKGLRECLERIALPRTDGGYTLDGDILRANARQALAALATDEGDT